MYFSLLLSSFTFILLLYFSNLSSWEVGAVSVFVFSLFNFLKRLSEKFVFLDIIILIASIQWVLAPVIGYQIFNKNNDLAFLWKTYMKIPSDDYFSFVLPGSMLFFLGLKFPLSTKPIFKANVYIENARAYISDKNYLSIYLVLLGFFFTIIHPVSPVIIRGIIGFLSQITFVGVFYALYSRFQFKKSVVAVVVSLLVIQCVLTGMYGALIFWSLLVSVQYFIGKSFQFWKRLTFLLVGVFLIFVIQSIKGEYREKTWESGMERNADPAYFGELVWERLTNPSTIFELERLFGMANRMNQGVLIADAINYVPKHEPFANGETIYMAVVSSLVPRVVWPNKPQTGGKAMVVRFLGAPDNLEYSFNLSPIGEAYVNFGRYGGIAFMFIYGLFFNYVFLVILRMSIKTPSLIFWLPVMFIGPITSMETDVLSAVNSLMKGAFFVWLMYFSFRILFKIRL